MIEQSNNTRYLALPPAGRGPALLVLHAWWGLNDFMRSFCDRLAQEGYVVLAPDMFSGRTADTIGDAEKLVTSLNWDADIPPKILPAVDDLMKNPAVTGSELGVLGISFGAFWALWLAQQRPELIRAVSLLYGTNGGGGNFQQSRAAFQGHFAENDPNEPADAVKALEQNLKSANRPTTFYTYPGTGHWFFEDDRPEAYQPQAARLVWDRTRAFLHEQLEGQLT